MAEARPPEIFHQYVLFEHIASGGMAEVFRAVHFGDAGFERLCVVKRILKERAADTAFVEMFLQEARLAASLHHPCVVAALDLGTHRGLPYLVLEHVEGMDLRRLMKAARRAKQRMPAHLAAWVAIQACEGLSHAHNARDPSGAHLQIVHRDISPGNLLITRDGSVRITDFGVASTSAPGHDDAGLIKGTAEYMSPEQANGQRVDARSDVFSVGAVLYGLLTGKRAFRGSTLADTFARVKSGDFVPVREVDPAISRPLAAICNTALSPDPARRFRTAAQMAEALRDALEPLGESEVRAAFSAWVRELVGPELEEERLSTQDGVARARQVWAERKPERKPAAIWPWMWGAVAVLLGVLGLGGLLMLRPGAPDVGGSTLGALAIDVTPQARILLSDREVGVAETLTIPDLIPGDYDLRFEAEGYVAVEDRVRVTRGGTTRVRHRLEVVRPELAVRSSPEGAALSVNGEVVGRAPLSWTVPAQGRFVLELTMDGHEPDRIEGDVEHLAGLEQWTGTLKPVVRAARPAAPRVAATGEAKLRVTLTGATWANVYLNGKRLPQRAPLPGVEIPAGRHTIRVENPAMGLRHEEVVEVSPGGVVTVRAR